MKKLLKEYKFNSDMQYYEMCIESYINGQISQAKEQFKALPKLERKAMVGSMVKGDWGVSNEIKNFFFNQL